MNYTSIRQLYYRERTSLDEFNVLDEAVNILVCPFLYNRLLQIEYLHPMHDYANEEVLRIFNDVYYFMTLFFHDDNPLMHYADYRKISNPHQEKDMISQNRTWVELAMIYVILQRWNRTTWFREKKSHTKVFEIIKREVDNYMDDNWISYTDEDVASIIIEGCEIRDFMMSIDYDFPLRNIQDVIDGNESLKDCLSVGADLRNVVNHVCKDNEQKLALIERLLEPEKEHYGVFDSIICSAYRSLYELKSELTGESLPEELPFEKAGTCTPPMMPTPPSIQDYQKENKTDDRDARIAELEKEVRSLKKQLSDCATDDDVAEIFNDDERGEPQEDKQPQAEKLNSESDSHPQELTDALKKIEEQEETIKDLNETIFRYQMRGLPPAKRKGIALGLTPLQADIFGDYLAEKFGMVFDNKKEELSLILNCLFGQGRSSLANKMHMTTGAVDDRRYVASIFGPTAPKIAKEICSDWNEDTPAPWEEEEETDDESD